MEFDGKRWIGYEFGIGLRFGPGLGLVAYTYGIGVENMTVEVSARRICVGWIHNVSLLRGDCELYNCCCR